MKDKKTRTFTEHATFFDLDESLHDSFYESRTRIIVSGNAMVATKGIQILRFHRFKSEELDAPWQLAGNPYAGIYLLPSEWEQVFRKLNQAAAKSHLPSALQPAEREGV